MSSSREGSGNRPTARASWDTYHPPRRYQALWVGLGIVCLPPALAATALRVAAPTDDVLAVFASFSSYAVLPYALALVCFVVALVRSRRKVVLAVLSGCVAALLVGHLVWLAPFFVSDHRAARPPSFTVLSLNLKKGAADPQQVADRAGRADVVVLLEARAAGVEAMRRYGFQQRFPYSVGRLGGQVGDTILFSRYPLSEESQLPQSAYQSWVTTVDVPEVGKVRVIAAHPCNPFCGRGSFATEHRALRQAADANRDGPLVVAGDLNATDDHAPLRAMKRDGLESVTDIVGAGWLPTYPAGSRVPPLLPIDHILLDHSLTATSVERVRVDGTDHLGLVAVVARAR